MSPLQGPAVRRLLALGAGLPDPGTRYRVLREVGRGGMGVVYEAEDLYLHRRVAWKVLETPSPELRERLQREAAAAARLSHPNIAAVYDATPDAIAMQFVDGGPLPSLPAIPLRQLVTLVRDAAHAVHHAHGQGLVHRDLKPSNLLVAGERVYVVDFGLCKETAVDVSLSQTGSLLGTPAFMAPEQAQGRNVDARTDVYGLGATLYAGITGKPPFEAAELPDLLAAIVGRDPRPTRCDRDLDIVLQRALAKEPERRYPTALAFAEDLERWLQGLPVQARAPSFGYRSRKFLRRRRALVRTAVIACVLAAGAVLAVLGPTILTQRAAAEALELSFRSAAILTDVEALRRRGRQPEAAVIERLDAGIADARAFVSEHPVARAWHVLGRLLRARGRPAEAKAAFDEALALDPSLGGVRFERGLVTIDSDPEQAVVDLGAEVGAGEHLATTDLLFGRAERHRLLGETETATALLEQVRRLDPSHIGALLSLAKILGQSSDPRAVDYAMHCSARAVNVMRGFGPAYSAEDRLTGEGLPARLELHLPGVEGTLCDVETLMAADQRDSLAFLHQGLDALARGAAMQTAGDREGALVLFQEAMDHHHHALSAEPESEVAFNNRGVVELERERCMRALLRSEDADRARQGARSDFDLARHYAPALLSPLQNQALSALREAERLSTWGAFAAAAAELDTGVSACWQALALRPDDVPLLLQRALVFEQLARNRELGGEAAAASAARTAAAADFDRADSLQPRSARTLLLRGLFRVRTGNRDEGCRDLQHALEQAPADWPHAALCRQELAAARRMAAGR